MLFSAKFLGVQRFSYNQFLEFELSVEELYSSVAVGSGTDENFVVSGSPSDVEDIILEGEGIRVTASITSQVNYKSCHSKVMKSLIILHNAIHSIHNSEKAMNCDQNYVNVQLKCTEALKKRNYTLCTLHTRSYARYDDEDWLLFSA